MFSSPEPTPGHYADPFLKERHRMLNDYNKQLAALRDNGIKDHVGHPVYGAEKEVRKILTGAINQTDKARSLETLDAIKVSIGNRLAEAIPNHKAAA